MLSDLHFRNQQNNARALVQTSLNSISGIFWALDQNTESSGNYSLFETDENQISLDLKTWGLFEVITSTSIKGPYISQKTALIGHELDQSNCLIMGNQNRPLAVCGSTRIKGNAVIPNAGVKRAYIEGQTYNGDQLIYGITSKTSSILSFNSTISAFTNSRLLNADSILEPGLQDSLIQAFGEGLIEVSSSGSAITLSQYLKGHIVVTSDESIIITRNAKLEDILLMAPRIVIEPGFEGSFQGIATKEISCTNASLKYPSALLVVDEKGEGSGIDVKSSSIEGCIQLYQKNQDQTTAGINIGSESVIIGSVSSNQWIDLKGNVSGVVRTNKFRLKTPSSIYENHLLNANISQDRIPVHYSCGIEESGNSAKTVVKWLD